MNITSILVPLLILISLAFGCCGSQSNSEKWANKWLVLAYVLAGIAMFITIIYF